MANLQSLLEDNMISSHDMTTQAYTIFLDEGIGEPSKYRELVSILFGANEGDKINIFINSPGGRLDSANAIIEGLKVTQATVIGHVIGDCHSAASMIALNCENLAVYDSAECMVHTASFGAGGSTGNVKSHVDFTHSQVEKLLDNTYKYFLTEDELVDLKKGCEFYFNADEMRERVQRRHEALEAEGEVTELDDTISDVEEKIKSLRECLKELKEAKKGIKAAEKVSKPSKNPADDIVLLTEG